MFGSLASEISVHSEQAPLFKDMVKQLAKFE